MHMSPFPMHLSAALLYKLKHIQLYKHTYTQSCAIFLLSFKKLIFSASNLLFQRTCKIPGFEMYVRNGEGMQT